MPEDNPFQDISQARYPDCQYTRQLEAEAISLLTEAALSSVEPGRPGWSSSNYPMHHCVSISLATGQISPKAELMAFHVHAMIYKERGLLIENKTKNC